MSNLLSRAWHTGTKLANSGVKSLDAACDFVDLQPAAIRLGSREIIALEKRGLLRLAKEVSQQEAKLTSEEEEFRKQYGKLPY